MPPRDIARRLAALEAADQARMERVYDRVLQVLTDDELARFGAVLKRHQAATAAGDLLYLSDDEKWTLCRVECLTQADPEMRPGDLMNIPQAWMEECGYVS